MAFQLELSARGKLDNRLRQLDNAHLLERSQLNRRTLMI